MLAVRRWERELYAASVGGKYDCSRASFVGGLLMCVSGAR